MRKKIEEKDPPLYIGGDDRTGYSVMCESMPLSAPRPLAEAEGFYATYREMRSRKDADGIKVYDSPALAWIWSNGWIRKDPRS